MISGKFITIEGGEGTGKTTQTEMLVQSLQSAGIPVKQLRSPGGTAVAEQLRKILKTRIPEEDLFPETELLLFGACHTQMCRYAVAPALAQGTWVVCDRFFDSTTVYQGFVRGLPLETVDQINRLSCGNTMPDLTILLDIDPESGLRRAGGRTGGTIDASDRFDSEALPFHRAIRDSFLKQAERFPDRIRICSAEPAPEIVAENIRKTVNHAFGLDLV